MEENADLAGDADGMNTGPVGRGGGGGARAGARGGRGGGERFGGVWSGPPAAMESRGVRPELSPVDELFRAAGQSDAAFAEVHKRVGSATFSPAQASAAVLIAQAGQTAMLKRLVSAGLPVTVPDEWGV